MTDPLGAVPDLPFGHLHEAWRTFVSAIPPGATVRRFSARWRPHRYRDERLEGFVVQQGRRLGAHWVSSRVRVEESK
ncbi:MAG: hypothetical protein JO111_16020 [Caulobacteraceae bacterium]|nr:hypothetical protein [Caulobacteraceae bacterium]